MSERRPGLAMIVMFDPEIYDGQSIPEAMIDDLADWLAERHLFGTFTRLEFLPRDDQPRVIDGINFFQPRKREIDLVRCPSCGFAGDKDAGVFCHGHEPPVLMERFVRVNR